MEDEIEPGTNPLAIASLVLAIVGVVIYCCGSFICLGWVGIFVWLLGAILGGVALAQGGNGTSKALAGIGVALNLLFLLAMGAMMLLGLGMGMLSSISEQ